MQPIRATLGLTLVTALLSLALPVRAADSPAPMRAASVGTAPDGTLDYTFVSSPDLFNTDLGSVRRIAPHARVDSWDKHYARAVDVVLDSFAAERPEDLLVAGDLVEGHWGIDDAHTGIFGRVGADHASRRQALTRAARFYYDQWGDRFDRRGLDVHVALGDHELGDDGWSSRDSSTRFKQSTVPLRKKLFADRLVRPHHYGSHPHGPARGTAYATYLDPEVLLVSLDEFEQTTHDVRLGIDRRQARWLDAVLAQANRRGVDWTIVQGHLPVLGPVRTKGSSGLFVPGRQKSLLWRTLVRNRVDLYLAGEVHAVTARRSGGVQQVTHGGLFGFGLTSYLVGGIDGDLMGLRIKDFRARIDHDGPRLWQTETSRGAPARIAYGRNPPARGTIVLRSDNVLVRADGLLGPYRP